MTKFSTLLAVLAFGIASAVPHYAFAGNHSDGEHKAKKLQRQEEKRARQDATNAEAKSDKKDKETKAPVEPAKPQKP